MADDIKKIIQDVARATAQEMNQDLGVKMEALQSDMKQVLEGVEAHTQQLNRIEKQTEKIEPMQDDIEAIKVTLDTVKSELNRKADREELSALELKLRPA
jgi:hypothetical protein